MRVERDGAGTLVALTSDSVRELWSKTYNTHGKPDWGHIFPYYHDHIVFRDSIQRIEGKPDFMAMCRRLTRRCTELRMEILTVAATEDGFVLEWIMTMIFRRSPSSSIYGCTRLTVHEDGLIIGQRDYYDLWGDIFDNIPGFRRLYRSFMRRLFG